MAKSLLLRTLRPASLGCIEPHEANALRLAADADRVAVDDGNLRAACGGSCENRPAVCWSVVRAASLLEQ